jgi:hypothetical protein
MSVYDPLSGASNCESGAAEEPRPCTAAENSEFCQTIHVIGRALPAESQLSVDTSPLPVPKNRQLKTFSLVCLIFLQVSGGPVWGCLLCIDWWFDWW